MLPKLDGITRVPAEGPTDATVVGVGEAPGEFEVRKLRPFYPQAPAGGVLEECLHAAGLIRSEVFLTNVWDFKVVKKGTSIYDQKGELLWTDSKGFTEASQLSLARLYREIKNNSASTVVAFGNYAVAALTDVWPPKILARRGSIYWSNKVGKKIVATPHPSFVLQSGNYLTRYHIVFDLRRAKEEAQTGYYQPLKQRFVWNPDFNEAMFQLEHYKREGLKGKRINYDIELLNEEISRISFATDIKAAVSIPFDTRWLPEQEVELWRGVSGILSNSKISKTNANILFDAFVTSWKNCIPTLGRLDDPMTGNHIIYPDFKKGLDFLTSIHTKIQYYKDEGKVWKMTHLNTKEKQERFGAYSCQDSCTSIECMDKIDEELDSQGYRDQYEDTIRIYRPLLAMMLRGIATNAEKIEEVKKEIQEKIDTQQAELNLMCECDLNVNSFKQMKEYFQGKLGIPPLLNTKGKESYDDKVLARLAKGTQKRPALKEARLIQSVRGMLKLKNTYFEIRFDGDGRFRCSYNPRGTTTGRRSSSKTLFETGMNHQNLPPEYTQFLVPDPGYFFIELDKAGAEWVVTAYVSGDPRMIQVVEGTESPHVMTGSLISGMPKEDVLREHKIIGNETNPEIIQQLREEFLPDLIERAMFLPRSMSARQAGKKSNHGLNYGMGHVKFAMENEIPETDSRMIVQKYHSAYLGLRGNYYPMIEKQLSVNRTLTNCFGDKRRFLNRWGHELFLSAYDYIPQSTVAKLNEKGIVGVYEDKDPVLADLEILAEKHDSTLFQHPIVSAKDVLDILYRIRHHYDIEMSYSGRTFKIREDFKISTTNWRDMQEVRLDVDQIEEALNHAA